MQTSPLKKLTCAGLAAFSIIGLGSTRACAQSTPPTEPQNQSWRFGLPPAPGIPSYGHYMMQIASDERHGDSSFGMQQVDMEFPLWDPRKTSYGNWLMLGALSFSYTHIDSSHQMRLDHEDLYRCTLPLGTMLRRQKDSFLFMMTPSLASDFETMNSSASVGAFFAYSRQHKDDFRYSVGVGYFPRSILFGFLPFANFTWEFAPQWNVELDQTTLLLHYEISERQTIAAFARYDAESWTIHTDRGARNLSVSSVVLGAQWEYNIAPSKTPQRIVRLELGMPLYTDMDIEYRHGDRDSELDARYRPTLQFTVGLDMRF